MKRCPLRAAGFMSCTGMVTTSPYGGSSFISVASATEFHQAPESNLTTVLFLLNCDISLSGQSDKTHMTSPLGRTDRARSRSRIAVIKEINKKRGQGGITG